MPKVDYRKIVGVLNDQFKLSLDSNPDTISPRCSCSEATYNALPDMSIHIDSSVFVVPKETFITYGFSECTLNLYGIDYRLEGSNSTDQPVWILGDSFLQHYYSIYDHQNMRVGFAPSIMTDKADIFQGILDRKLNLAGYLPGTIFFLVMFALCYCKSKVDDDYHSVA